MLIAQRDRPLACHPEGWRYKTYASDGLVAVAERRAPSFARFANWGILIEVNLEDHLRLTGSALKNWAIAQCQDSLAVGAMWYIGLRGLHVPLALLWAIVAAVLQFVPHLGPALGMVAPTVTAAIHFGDWQHPLYVLMLYAGTVVVDALALQPYLMKRTAKVPIWASIVVPIVLAFVLPFWGIFLAPPLLAVVYAYKRHIEQESTKART